MELCCWFFFLFEIAAHVMVIFRKMKLPASERYVGFLLHVICSSGTLPTPPPPCNKPEHLFPFISNLQPSADKYEL